MDYSTKKNQFEPVVSEITAFKQPNTSALILGLIESNQICSCTKKFFTVYQRTSRASRSFTLKQPLIFFSINSKRTSNFII